MRIEEHNYKNNKMQGATEQMADIEPSNQNKENFSYLSEYVDMSMTFKPKK